MNTDKLNWGIIATGNIAKKFAEALVYCSQQDSTINLYAVASRDRNKAEGFRTAYGFDKAYDSYSSLLDDPEVNVVYIATPHTFHAEIALEALNKGKHVICEKPAAVNAATLSAVIDKAEEKKLFFMEATWSCFNPVVLEVMETIKKGTIGSVLNINASFCFRREFNEESRLFNPQLAGGALLDVGIYPVTFAMLTAKAASLAGKQQLLSFSNSTVLEPRKVTSSARMYKGMDLWNTMSLTFADGMSSHLQSALDVQPVENSYDAYIYGTKGYIKIPYFWMSQEAFVYNYSGNAGDEAALLNHIEHKFLKNGYEYEIIEACSCIKKGMIESPLHSSMDALSVLKVLDTIRSQWKMEYPFEKDQLQRIMETQTENGDNKMNEVKNNSGNAGNGPLIIYTDGGCSGNPGPGGWGCVLIDGSNEMQYSGGEKNTTNNRMELMAAINALSHAAQNYKNRKIEVFSDSQYVKNGITSWISGWKKNGWKTAAKKPVLNQDLWVQLDELYSSLDVEWKWVKGHAGVKYNEICDQLCQKEIALHR